MTQTDRTDRQDRTEQTLVVPELATLWQLKTLIDHSLSNLQRPGGKTILIIDGKCLRMNYNLYLSDSRCALCQGKGFKKTFLWLNFPQGGNFVTGNESLFWQFTKKTFFNRQKLWKMAGPPPAPLWKIPRKNCFFYRTLPIVPHTDLQL